jgi:exodeoxyribonuclease VII small subunit
MSKASRPTSSGDPAELSFGEALTRLQGVVEAMESEDLPLETLLARYEEGIQLARVCETKLAGVEVRIQQVEQTAAGELQLKPWAEPEPPDRD